MNEVFDYRKKTIHLNTCLQKIMNDLYAYGINVGMLNELKDLSGIFKKEKVPVDISLLAALHDPIIKPLVDLIYTLDCNRQLIMDDNGLSETEMAEAFYRGEGDANWPDFFLFKGGSYMDLACSILQYHQHALLSLFCIANQLSVSKMYCPQADCQPLLQYPMGAGFSHLDKDDRNVLLILGIMKETHESMKRVYEIAESLNE